MSDSSSIQLREFAEKVVFGTSLEEKLAPPTGLIIDSEPGRAISTPDSPGRPDDLAFQRGHRTKFPRHAQLEDTHDRTILLHFFANHELLAAELMALVLLKFPDAPPEFRKGILRTLREEQEHTRLYVDRMQQCGLQFGDLPVNGFFWRNISGMESPVDYVARMSLTFEQANLDYSRHYADVFEKSGDSKTAKILDRIYRDEISHVGYGLKWFRRWKSEGTSDWAAYSGQLKFPLTPQRAKGKAPFNREGRSKAGLDADFIEKLQVSTASRGRTPHIYWFNPGAEGFAAAPNSTLDPKTHALMQDLETVPIFLCREDDCVALSRQPSISFLQRLMEAGIPIPELELLNGQGQISAKSPLAERKLGGFRPWGWSPDSVAFFEPLQPHVSTVESSRNTRWSPELTALYSKVESSKVLCQLIGQSSELDDQLVPASESWPITNTSELDAIRKVIAGLGYETVLVRSAYGLAGRGNLTFPSTDPLSPSPLARLQKILDSGPAIVTPFYQRICDFSVQYTAASDGKIRQLGYLDLHNDRTGRFIACTAHRRLGQTYSKESLRFLNEHPKDPTQNRWSRRFFKDHVPKVLAPLIAATSYSGPLGIDAFLYRDSSGSLRLHPLVEINPRYTMGRLTHELMRFVAPERSGRLRILARSALKKLPYADFSEFDQAVTEAHPLRMDQSSGLIAEGMIPLNDPAIAREFFAVFAVGHPKELDSFLGFSL